MWKFGQIREAPCIGGAGRFSIISRRFRLSPYGRRGLIVRCFYLLVALLSWATGSFRHSRKGGRIILCYHSVSQQQKAAFNWQMRQIRGRAIASNQLKHAGNHCDYNLLNVCVTFDDAFTCIIENAITALRKHRIPATIFVPTANLGETPQWYLPDAHPDMVELVFSQMELINVANDSLITIGSHTDTHPNLSLIGYRDILLELQNSKAKLERSLKVKIHDFAFPFGGHCSMSLSLASKVGYQRLYTLEPRITHNWEHILGRFLMSPDVWKIEYYLTCRGAYYWQYYLRALHRLMRSQITKRKFSI